jgi:Lon protease-like protein
MSDDLQLASVPLFPLGLVLFPGGLLPLRIFEVRYLDMVSKCYRAGSPFGVVSLIEGTEVRRRQTLASGGEGFASETFHDVGTLATITELTSPQPGLLLIRSTGTQRFHIERRSQLKHGLWVGDITLLGPDPSVTVPDDLLHIANALDTLIKGLLEQDLQPEQWPVQAPFLLQDCAWVANRWCELLPMLPELKQRLMVLDNSLLRLELVGDFLERHGIVM